MGWTVLDFLVRWSSLLSHGLLQWQRKFLEYWCSPEIIPLYLQYVLLLCWKCRLYNTGSVQLPVLSNSLVPRAGPMCAFSWVFNELWTWYLMAPKVLCWSQSCSPSSRALKYLGCVFKAWAFSTWSVLDLGACPIGELVIAYQSHLYLIKMILPCTNITLFRIYYVQIRWCQLVFYMVLSVKVFNDL